MRLVEEGASLVVNDVLPDDQLATVVPACGVLGCPPLTVWEDISEAATQTAMRSHIGTVANNS